MPHHHHIKILMASTCFQRLSKAVGGPDFETFLFEEGMPSKQ
jgi:hypothetical protein